MDEAEAGGIVETLRRVVLGFRGAAGVWVLALGVLALASGTGRWRVLVGVMIAAATWTAMTIVLAQRRPSAVRGYPFLVADVAVAGAIVTASAAAESSPLIAGGYPFSAALLVTYSRGAVPGLASAAALSLVVIRMNGLSAAVTDAFVYLVGVGVAAWGIDAIRQTDAEQRRLAAQLANERAERARADERAEAANALHDSVMQTLALVQRRRNDPEAVAALAHRGERELRRWVTGGPPVAGSLAAAVEQAAMEVEETHGLAVEVVSVGDRPMDAATAALVAAAREALLNVAKHAGTPTATLYAEAADDEVLLTVRDRGQGFDPEAVPEGRHGVSESIVERVRRVGGRATIRSQPGTGTEVELVLPLHVPTTQQRG